MTEEETLVCIAPGSRFEFKGETEDNNIDFDLTVRSVEDRDGHVAVFFDMPAWDLQAYVVEIHPPEGGGVGE